MNYAKRLEDAMKLIPLGALAEDRVTGFTGVVDAYCVYLNGCVHVSLQPRVKSENPHKVPNCRWFDYGQVNLVKADALKPTKPKRKAASGGPMHHPARL